MQQEVRRQRAALGTRGFVQLAYDPGEKMQLDFGEERLAVGGRIVTVHYLAACCATVSTPSPGPAPRRPRSACWTD